MSSGQEAAGMAADGMAAGGQSGTGNGGTSSFRGSYRDALVNNGPQGRNAANQGTVSASDKEKGRAVDEVGPDGGDKLADRVGKLRIEDKQEQEPAATPNSPEAEQQATLTTSPCSADGSAKGPSASSGSSDLNPQASAFKPVPPPAAASSPSAGKVFEAREVAYGNLGVFAATRIPRGTLILVEEPLLATTSLVAQSVWVPYCQLDDSAKAAYDSLFACAPEHLDLEYISRTCLVEQHLLADELGVRSIVAKHVRVMSIFMNNNIQTPFGQFCIYVIASRFNHSCVPNVYQSWNSTTKQLQVHAVRDIEPDEQLYVTYLGSQGNYYLRSQRIEILRSNFGFTCHCKSCADPTNKSDKRRERTALVGWGLEQFEAGIDGTSNQYIPNNADIALLQAKDFIALLLNEGIHTLDLAKAYHTASVRALAVKDFDKAIDFCHKEIEVERNCLGVEREGLFTMRMAAECWRAELLYRIRNEAGYEQAIKYMTEEERETIEGAVEGAQEEGRKKHKKSKRKPNKKGQGEVTGWEQGGGQGGETSAPPSGW
ncbi:uncharacterized protein LTR77_009193 [Saxophila tyrrhenica]|uniref:SET domain-containing protein n=1 Tax=Saxophila tyrrhenica TaxID=1690608 RepID=A0AAV9NYE0_9PEZI|nr:hypothetical protein LTR77_009193 [Saxophila tyrrhenica]